MLNSGYGGLPVSEGKQFRPSLPMGVRNPFIEVMLYKTCKSSFRAGYYAGHSFRIGDTTMVAVASHENLAVQTLG